MKKKLKNIQNKESTKIIASFFAGIIITLLACSLINKNKMAIDVSVDKQDTNELVAKINNEKIYASQINEKLVKINPKLTLQNLNSEDKELLIKEVFVQRKIWKNALKNKSYKKYSPALRNFAIEETKNNYLDTAAEKQVTDKQVKNKYLTLVESLKGKKEYLISHILTKNKSNINKARNNLNKNSFADTAKKFSIDNNSSKNGGDLGYIVEGSTIEQFENQIKKLKKNGISKPFKTDLGWHIVQLKDSREAVPAEYEVVKERIRSSLVADTRKSLVLDLIKDAKIEIF